jgi:hypothetical protein
VSEICGHCGVCSRNPCSRYTGSNRFDGCYNLSRESQLLALSADGDEMARQMLELLRENEELKGER